MKPKSQEQNSKKTNPKHKNNNTINPKSSLPSLNLSTQRLKSKITQFKSQQGDIIKKLQDSILNNKLYRSVSEAEISNLKHVQFLDKRHFVKQKSLSFLSKKLQKRLLNDQESQRRLQQMKQTTILKKKSIQIRLKQIQERNNKKISQIQQFQRNFIEKVKFQMLRNMEKQKKLKKQLDKIKKETQKIKKVKQTQNNLDKQGWKNIMQEKINLQQIMENQKNRQNKLVEQKNPEIHKKQQQKLTIAKQKQIQKKVAKQKVKLDPKQAGNRYLDFAKKRGSPATKQGKKIKGNQFNINLKIINYDHDILDKIATNFMNSQKEQKKVTNDDQTQQRVIKIQNQSQNSSDIQVNEIDDNIIPVLIGQNNPEYEIFNMDQTNKMVQRIQKDLEKIETVENNQFQMNKTIYNM